MKLSEIVKEIQPRLPNLASTEIIISMIDETTLNVSLYAKDLKTNLCERNIVINGKSVETPAGKVNVDTNFMNIYAMHLMNSYWVIVREIRSKL